MGRKGEKKKSREKTQSSIKWYRWEGKETTRKVEKTQF